MNTIYKIVRNASTGKWVVASELAKGRKKKSSYATALALLCLTTIANTNIAFAANEGNGSLQLCSNDGSATTGTSIGYGSTSTALPCNDGYGVAFSLNNNGKADGSAGYGASTARVTGFANGKLELKGIGISLIGPVTFDNNASMASHKITNLANGVSSSDATSIGQLSPAVNALGGGAKIDATTGTVTGPSYTLTNGGTQTTVDGALKGLDGTLTTTNTNVTTNKTNIASLQDLISQDATSKKISIGGALDGDTVDISGKSGAQMRKLTGLADAALTDTSTDAVTGKQLYATNQNVAANKTSIDELQGQISGGTLGLVQQDPTSKTITVGAGVDGDTVDFTGKTGGRALSRKLTGVSDGALSATSTDAVNGAQLYATNQNVATNKADIATTNTNLTTLQEQVSNGTLGLVQQDATTHAITLGASTGGTSFNITGTDGARVLSGVANGTENTDAVTIAQLKAVGLADPNGKPIAALTYDDLTLATAMLGGTKGTTIRNLANGSIAHGSMEAINGGQLFDFEQATKQQMDALSGQVNAINNTVQQIQQGLGDGSLGGGAGGHGTGANSTVLGDGANASGTNSTALGAGANATGENSTATGANSIASGNNSTATGANSVASGDGSTANGANAVASGNNSTALGSNSSATGSNSVALGAGSVADRDNTVSVGSVGNERQITNVAAGTQRTDAANWGQVQDAVNDVKDWARGRFEQQSKQASAGTAAAMAMTNIPQAYAPNQSSLGAAVGSYKGQSAVAVGMSTITPGGRWVFKGSLTGNTQGDVGVGMGASMVW